MTFLPIPFIQNLMNPAGPIRRYVVDGRLEGHRNGVYVMAASSNGFLLASGGA